MSSSPPRESSDHDGDQAATLRAMARERFVTPSTNGDANAGASSTRVLTVTSGKGGVGKTLVTANLAIALALQGKKVLVLDADLGLANIDLMLGLDPEYDMSHVIGGERSLSEVIVKGPADIGVIPASSGDEELANLDDAGQLNLLAQFEALAPELDFLLIDSAAGLSKNVIYFNLAAQAAIVVVTPEPTSITDAYAIIKVLSQQHGVSRFYLVINRVKNEEEGQQVFERLIQVSERFLRSVALEALAFLPEDHRVSRSIRSRQPILQAYPRAPITEAIHGLAERVARLPLRDFNAGYPGFLRNPALSVSET